MSDVSVKYNFSTFPLDVVWYTMFLQSCFFINWDPTFVYKQITALRLSLQ